MSTSRQRGRLLAVGLFVAGLIVSMRVIPFSFLILQEPLEFYQHSSPQVKAPSSRHQNGVLGPVIVNMTDETKDGNAGKGNKEEDHGGQHSTLFRQENRAASESAPSKEPQERPNIVLFYADDWTFRTLGVVNPHVKTAHLDELASNGVLFTRNAVTTSICWISRANLMTSMYAAKHGQLKKISTAMFDETLQWNNTLYPQLKAAGYHTAFVGKWHAPAPREFMKFTFDHRLFYSGAHYMKRHGVQRHITDWNRRDALHYLRKLRPKNNQPFALTVSFFATHAWDGKRYPNQYNPQQWSRAYYDDNATIPLPKTATKQHWQEMPWFFDERNEGRIRWHERYKTETHYQDTMKKYYRMATEVDEACGSIIQELKRQGLYNNTLFIFTTDNGNFHGEHGLADKWYPHEESIRVPLIIQDPRMSNDKRGKTNDEFTLSIDLAPTILSAAGIPVPTFMQGRDMAQLYLSTNDEMTIDWRNDFFYEWNRGEPIHAVGHDNAYYHMPAVFALIGKDYKYFHWPQIQYEQLFHISSDPFEEHDIYNASARTTPDMLEKIKRRYSYLKTQSQAGYPV